MAGENHLGDECVHRTFERVAAANPDAIAVDHETGALSYGELNQRANRVAHHLRRMEVAEGSRVAICFDRTPDTVVAALAVVKAGCAYLPLDPSYPRERLAFILQDAEPECILTTSELVDRLPNLKTLRLDDASSPMWRESVENPQTDLSFDDLAYMIYTSGSTGLPKGVLLGHGGLANLVQAQIAAFEIGPTSRVLQFASPGFDASVSEIFTALCAGAALCLAPRDALLPGPTLKALLHQRAITVVTLPPSALAIMDPGGLDTLRTVVTAGEACSSPIVARWSPGRRFINAYGPTETTVCATWSLCQDGRPSIGKPLANTTVHVLGEDLAPVAVGEVGELFIGGVGVSRGYWKRPELTAQKFVSNPFGPGKLYRSGDLVRWGDDGNLDYIGRIDNQVKLRGFRIELGEIEEVLRQHPDVVDTAVIMREDAPGDKRLVAYVVSRGERSVDALKRHVKPKLPEYMVPTAFVWMESLPLTPNGKVNRAELPLPSRSRPDLGVAYVAPRSDHEKAIVAIWERLLLVQPVGVDDDFFELGGHSLSAVGVAGEMEALLGRPIPAALLFEQRTVAALAKVSRDGGGASSILVQLKKGGRKRPFFCMHPVTGNVLCYADLARRFSAERSFYGLECPALHGATFGDLGELASRYVDAIVSVQAKGPYLLGGWSVGGTVAFAVAQELRRRGESVDLLALIEAWAPVPAMKEQAKGMNTAVVSFMFTKNLGRCRGKDLPVTPNHFKDLDSEQTVDQILEHLHQLDPIQIHPSVGRTQIRKLREVFETVLRSYVAFPLTPYDGKITQFQVNEAAPGHPRPPKLGWEDYTTQPIEYLELPGNHFTTVYEPHVAALADFLNERVARVD